MPTLHGTPKEMTEQAAYNRLAALCSRTEYCLSDLRHKLQAWLLPEGADERILRRLQEEKYVDEERYACAFARDKFRQNRWGRQRVAMELRRRGIDDDHVAAALREIPDSDSDATLASLLRQRLRATKAKDDTELFLKLLRYSVGRGYSLDEAHRCLKQLFTHDPETTL